MYPVQNIRSLSFTSASRSTNTFIVYVARVPRITHALGQREVGGQNFVGPRRICQLEMTKFSRLDVWGRAQIVAYAKTGMAPATIATKVRKPGGGQPTPRAVRAVIQRARRNRTWHLCAVRDHAVFELTTWQQASCVFHDTDFNSQTAQRQKQEMQYYTVLALASKTLQMEEKEPANGKQANPTVNKR